MDETGRSPDETGAHSGRIDALSDGIFGVALTLLVLDLRVPQTQHVSTTELARQLTGLIPQLLAFVLTFATVGQYWIAHRRIMALVTRFDQRLLWLNLLFLMFVALLPFPTSLLTQGSWLAWTVYASNIVLVGGTLQALWWYAKSRGLADAQGIGHAAQTTILRGWIALGVFLLSVPLSLIDFRLGAFTPLLILPLNALYAPSRPRLLRRTT